MPKVHIRVGSADLFCSPSQVKSILDDFGITGASAAIHAEASPVQNKHHDAATPKAIAGQRIADFADSIRAKVSEANPTTTVRTLHSAQCTLRKRNPSLFKGLAKHFSQLLAARALLEHYDTS